jgi:hypothetical protein
MAPPKGQQRPLGKGVKHLLSRHSRLRLLHPADVSTLSGSDRESVSTPLQRGLRFFRHPMPAPSSAFLADCLPVSDVLESAAIDRGFLVPCDAMRVLLRRDTSFRAGLSLGGLMATYSRTAQEYPTTHLLVKAISSFSLSGVTKVHMTVHVMLPMRLFLSSSTALLLAVSIGSFARIRCHRSRDHCPQGFPPRRYRRRRLE